MNRLPNELLEMVCNECDFATLKSLRRTARFLIMVTTPLIFEHFYMGFFPSHLDRLVQLSHSPHVSVHIKKFTFVGDVLPDFKSQAAWENVIDLRPPWSTFSANYYRNTKRAKWLDQGCSDETTMEHSRKAVTAAYHRLPKHEMTPLQLHFYYLAYIDHRSQQLSWDDDMDETFVDAFARLPAIKTVLNETLRFAGNNEVPPWRSLRRKILVGPDNWMSRHMVETGINENEGQHSLLGESDVAEIHDSTFERSFETPIYMRHARCLLSALNHRAKNTTGVHVSDACLNNIGCQPFLRQSAPLQRPRSPQPPDMQAFATLTILQLTVHFDI